LRRRLRVLDFFFTRYICSTFGSIQVRLLTISFLPSQLLFNAYSIPTLLNVLCCLCMLFSCYIFSPLHDRLNRKIHPLRFFQQPRQPYPGGQATWSEIKSLQKGIATLLEASLRYLLVTPPFHFTPQKVRSWVWRLFLNEGESRSRSVARLQILASEI